MELQRPARSSAVQQKSDQRPIDQSDDGLFARRAHPVGGGDLEVGIGRPNRVEVEAGAVGRYRLEAHGVLGARVQGLADRVRETRAGSNRSDDLLGRRLRERTIWCPEASV